MKYQLIIKIPFEAMDDIQAREIAENFSVESDSMIYGPEKAEVKVQEVFETKPPRGITLNTTPKGQ